MRTGRHSTTSKNERQQKALLGSKQNLSRQAPSGVSWCVHSKRTDRLRWAMLALLLLLPQHSSRATARLLPLRDTPNVSIAARIEAVRKRAEGLRVDGSGEDWAGIPSYQAATTGTSEAVDPSRRIVRVSIAPRQRDLLVALWCAGPPSREPYAFGLNIAFMGRARDDIQIPLDRASDTPSVWIYEPGKPAVSVPFSGAQVAFGNRETYLVEIRIPFAALERALPTTMAQRLSSSGSEASPWVRVSPYSYDRNTRRLVDWGPSVASYRLLPTPYALDTGVTASAATGGAPAARTIPLPLQSGHWFVGQGAHQGPSGVGDHRDRWAYDLEQRDMTLHPSRVRASPRNEDYYGFGQTIVAPLAGVVLESRGAMEDHPARLTDSAGHSSNYLYLGVGDGQTLAFIHCRKGSISVTEGQAVRPGQPIGQVGNSGPSAWAHLHLSLIRGRDLNASLPLAFGPVRVSLNPTPDDYWAREEISWPIREGYFVITARAWYDQGAPESAGSDHRGGAEFRPNP